MKRGGSPWAPGCTTRVPRRKGQAGHRWKQSHPPQGQGQLLSHSQPHLPPPFQCCNLCQETVARDLPWGKPLIRVMSGVLGRLGPATLCFISISAFWYLRSIRDSWNLSSFLTLGFCNYLLHLFSQTCSYTNCSCLIPHPARLPSGRCLEPSVPPGLT